MVVRGGAAIGRRFLAAGLVDELVVHLAPVLLGVILEIFSGTPDDRPQPDETQPWMDTATARICAYA